MKRLVCVVEGYGELEALPNLCSRIFAELGVTDWIVDPDPIRRPRSKVVHALTSNARSDDVQKAAYLARARPADGVLFLYDADDACPVAWSAAAQAELAKILNGACVMAVREYEAWLLTAQADDDLRRVGVLDKLESHRDPKGILRTLVQGYKPTTHQLEQTRRLQFHRARALCPSFDKFYRAVAMVVGISSIAKWPESEP